MEKKVVQLPHPIGQKRYSARTQDGYVQIGADIVRLWNLDSKSTPGLRDGFLLGVQFNGLANLNVKDKNPARQIVTAHNQAFR